MMPSPTAVALSAGGLTFACWLYGLIQDRFSNPNRLPLPPGPKGHPIIGCLLQFPVHHAWFVYDEWSKVYGDMVFFKVLNQQFLLLGNLEKTYDIFERRSSSYSDRPRLPMMNEVLDWSWNMAFMRYGPTWRRHRRTFHDHFHPNVVQKYHPILIKTTRAFLRDLLDSPDNFMHHIRHSFASSIAKISYGVDIQPNDDFFVKNVEIALTGAATATHPGAFLVDIFPVMKYIPEWFPGASWKKKANFWKHSASLVVNHPWKQIKEKLRDGKATPCIAATLIEHLPDKKSPDRAEAEFVARSVCATALAGGADTTVSTVQSFFMAMALYLDAQNKAQVELDSVLGGRLPEFNDRPNLPYVNAMVKESMRWQLVAPLAIAHTSTTNEEYNGYFIPKGTIVMGNAWSILHDPEMYPEPSSYNPDRFLKDGQLDKTVRDPNVAFFGFGRRICPGRFLSEDSMFIIISHILTVFDVRPALDEEGNEIKIEPRMTGSVLSYPEPFKCRITPRSKKVEALIRDTGIMD